MMKQHLRLKVMTCGRDPTIQQSGRNLSDDFKNDIERAERIITLFSGVGIVVTLLYIGLALWVW